MLEKYCCKKSDRCRRYLFVLGNFQSVAAAKQTEITVWKFGGAPAETEMWPVQTEIFAKTEPRY